MSSTIRRLACLGFLLGAALTALGQATAAAGVAPVHVSQSVAVPRLPGVKTLLEGFNAGVTFSSVHNSTVGWYTVATPAVNYTFSQHFSADASASVFLHRRVLNLNSATQASQPLVVDDSDSGDTLIGFHATFMPRALLDTITASFTAPTGNRKEGLGTGRVTYDFSNHAEHYFHRVGALLDVGAGDSSGLFNNLVVKNYNSLGGLAHFQAGAVLWLPRRAYVESVAYEQLPLGSQKVYRSVERGEAAGGRGEEDPGSPSPTPTPNPTPVSVSTVAEDNGFTTFVGIPLNNYFTLSGYYNRSLRQHADTVSFGITYVVRGTFPSNRGLSMIDKALLEAEGANQ